MAQENKSFHAFCIQRKIPKEIEENFIDYFKVYFKLYLKSENDNIINYLVENMTFDEIEKYWKIYVITLKQSLELYSQAETKRLNVLNLKDG